MERESNERVQREGAQSSRIATIGEKTAFFLFLFSCKYIFYYTDYSQLTE